MNPLELAGLGLIALFCYSIVIWVKAYKRGRLKYELKKSANSIRPLVHLVWAAFFIIGAVTVTPAIMEWADKQALGALSESSQWIYQSIPYVWVFTVCVIVFWFVGLCPKPWIKYSEEEKDWMKEEKVKSRAKLPKMLKWLLKV